MFSGARDSEAEQLEHNLPSQRPRGLPGTDGRRVRQTHHDALFHPVLERDLSRPHACGD